MPFGDKNPPVLANRPAMLYVGLALDSTKKREKWDIGILAV
jgi:hypothetical protein